MSGVEAKGHGILWSQPELVLYDRYEHAREAGGYPDFIESPKTGAIYITETQKDTARIHKIGSGLLHALWTQHNVSSVATGAALVVAGKGSHPAPKFGALGVWTHAGQGFTIEMVVTGHAAAAPGQALFDSTDAAGHGILLAVGSNHSLELSLSSASSAPPSGQRAMQTDPLCTQELLKPGPHHVAVTVDAGALVASFMVDGTFCDGGHAGPAWANGWFWVYPYGSLDGAGTVAVGTCNNVGHACTPYAGDVGAGRVYTRALMNSEVIGNYRAGARGAQL